MRRSPARPGGRWQHGLVPAKPAKKALFGLGWVLGGRKPGPSTADVQINEGFADVNEQAQERILGLRHEIPDPPVTWRCHDGTWERWSWLDSEFRAAPVPAALVAFVEGNGGIVDGQVLVFDDADWQTESEDQRGFREGRHDEVDLGEPDDLGQEVRLDQPAAEAPEAEAGS